MNIIPRTKPTAFGLALMTLSLAVTLSAAPDDKAKATDRKNKDAAAISRQKGISVQRASALIDMTVKDSSGKTIGTIHDVVLNTERDGVESFVVDLDDSAKQEKLALTPGQVWIDNYAKAVHLRSALDGLKQQAGFGDDTWPVSADATSENALTSEGAASRRVSNLIGMSVQDGEGEDVGEIEDLLVNTNTGDILLATVTTGGFLGWNAKLNTVDWSAVDVNAENEVVVVSESQQTLALQGTGPTAYWQEFGFDTADDAVAPNSPKPDADKRTVQTDADTRTAQAAQAAQAEADKRKVQQTAQADADKRKAKTAQAEADKRKVQQTAQAEADKRGDQKDKITQTSARAAGDTRQRHLAAEVVRASNLLDMDVVSRSGEAVGQVKDVVLTETRDSIAYLAVSLKDGEKNTLLAVPLQKLSLNQDGQALSLKASKSSLAEKGSFAEDAWPASADAKSDKTLAKDGSAACRLSKLVGMPVRSQDGKEIGAIEDLLISTTSGKIEKATVSTDKQDDAMKLTTVDWKSVDLKGAEGIATVDKTLQTIEREATGAKQYWQQFGFEGDDVRIRSRDLRQTDDSGTKQGNEPMKTKWNDEKKQER